MNFKKLVFLMIALGLIVSAASAIDTITVTSDKEWVAAGGTDTATIAATVLEGGTSVAGATVTFAVDPTYGSIQPASAVTDASGIATATFTANRTSGVAEITATAGGIAGTLWQKIDHGLPYQISYLAYDAEVTAGETTTITVGLADRYGNPVDNKGLIETVTFSVGSVSGDAVFIDGTSETDTITKPVDATGNVTVTLRTDRYTSGTYRTENIVWIDPPSTVPDRYITIYGIANGLPCSITATVSPLNDPLYVPADGSSVFYLSYYLTDCYGNPCGNRGLWINTTIAGEERLVYTSTSGEVIIEYGPKDMECLVNVTATAVDNATLVSAFDLLFYSPYAEKMLLTASPLTLPSADVPGNYTSLVRAKVIDQMGRPIAGVSVTFEIRDVDVGTFTATAPPKLIDTLDGTEHLASVTNQTDADGFAIVIFRPGAFAKQNEPGYIPMATGSCDVYADWTVPDSVTIEWKNYPYVSVQTEYSPPTVQVNDTVDVTLRLIGDGWELQQMMPIDVVFLLDRSEDMLLGDTAKEGKGPDRMEYARAAVLNFTDYVGSLGETNRVGFVPYGDNTTEPWSPWIDGSAGTDGVADILALKNYGWVKNAGVDGNGNDDEAYVNANYPGNGNITYRDYAEVWNSVDGSSLWGTNIQESLWKQVPLKDNNQGTRSAPLRKGLHTAITEVKDNPRSDESVRAIVLLMQNQYCYFGSPFGPDDGGTELSSYILTSAGSNNYYPFNDGNSENMATYARENDILIYTIYYAWSNSQSEEATPRRLADETGGKYFFVANRFDLQTALSDIAEDLKRHAGVNTTVALDFETVPVNENVTYSGSEIFDYIYLDNVSTHVLSYNNRTGMLLYDYTQDDTANWTANQTLNFDIGTIELGQVWEATFRLKVKKDGSIQIFGGNSSIMFDDTAESLTIPPLFITALLPNGTGNVTGDLQIQNLRCIDPEPPANASGMVAIAWDRLYTGGETAVEAVEYSSDNGHVWVPFDAKSGGSAPPMVNRTAILDLSSFPGGNYTLKLKVRAEAPDAPPAEASIDVDVSRSLVFIKIS
jgi:hypothetical protein